MGQNEDVSANVATQHAPAQEGRDKSFISYLWLYLILVRCEAFRLGAACPHPCRFRHKD